MFGGHMPKTRFIAMACDSKSPAIIWQVITMKLNIG